MATESHVRRDDISAARRLLAECGDPNPTPFELANTATAIAALRINHANTFLTWHLANADTDIPETALDNGLDRMKPETVTSTPATSAKVSRFAQKKSLGEGGRRQGFNGSKREVSSYHADPLR